MLGHCGVGNATGVPPPTPALCSTENRKSDSSVMRLLDHAHVGTLATDTGHYVNTAMVLLMGRRRNRGDAWYSAILGMVSNRERWAVSLT